MLGTQESDQQKWEALVSDIREGVCESAEIFKPSRAVGNLEAREEYKIMSDHNFKRFNQLLVGSGIQVTNCKENNAMLLKDVFRDDCPRACLEHLNMDIRNNPGWYHLKGPSEQKLTNENKLADDYEHISFECGALKKQVIKFKDILANKAIGNDIGDDWEEESQEENQEENGLNRFDNIGNNDEADNEDEAHNEDEADNEDEAKQLFDDGACNTPQDERYFQTKEDVDNFYAKRHADRDDSNKISKTYLDCNVIYYGGDKDLDDDGEVNSRLMAESEIKAGADSQNTIFSGTEQILADSILARTIETFFNQNRKLTIQALDKKLDDNFDKMAREAAEQVIKLRK